MLVPDGAIVPAEELGHAPPFFVDLYSQTMKCRHEHGCLMLPFEHGPLLSVIAAGCQQRGKVKRILEFGTGLGYATMWLAHGCPAAHIHTVDSDRLHADAARANFKKYGVDNRVRQDRSSFDDVGFEWRYDLIVFDGWEPELAHLREFERLLPVGGVLISSNLNYACCPANVEVRAYRDELRGGHWYSAVWGDGNTVMSVRL